MLESSIPLFNFHTMEILAPNFVFFKFAKVEIYGMGICPLPLVPGCHWTLYSSKNVSVIYNTIIYLANGAVQYSESRAVEKRWSGHVRRQFH